MLPSLKGLNNSNLINPFGWWSTCKSVNMIHAFSLVLDRVNQTQEKHILSIKLRLERQKNSPTMTELASNSKQNQDTPRGSLKLLPFRLPKDNLKRHMTFFLPTLLPLFPPSITSCLTGRCGSWQTGFVTCSKSVTADCTGLILTNSHIEWVESPAPPLRSYAGGGEAAFSGAAKNHGWFLLQQVHSTCCNSRPQVKSCRCIWCHSSLG